MYDISLHRFPSDAESIQEGLLDDFKRLREDFSDTIKDCASVLGESDCLRLICGRLRAETSEPANAQLSSSWPIIEACLHAINAIANDVPRHEDDVVPRLLEFLPVISDHLFIRYVGRMRGITVVLRV
jgi:hypothetical protein